MYVANVEKTGLVAQSYNFNMKNLMLPETIQLEISFHLICQLATIELRNVANHLFKFIKGALRNISTSDVTNY